MHSIIIFQLLQEKGYEMSNNMTENIWLIGASQMAVDYHEVLKDLNIPFIVIGRGDISAKVFREHKHGSYYRWSR